MRTGEDRDELRRQWGLLHTVDLIVVELHRSDLGFSVVIESALDRRGRGDGPTISAAILAARKSLGYFEESGRLVLVDVAAA